MTVYFTDEPEHITMLRDSVKKFVAKEMPAEKMRAWETSRTFPRDVFSKLAELGVCGLTVDEEYGGLGRDIVAAVMVLEELSRSGTALAGPFIHCAFYGGINISEKGSDAQKRDLLPKLASGELIFAYGLSEPNVGADLASVSTRAELIDDGKAVLVNGAKRWCTAAGDADHIYCLVKSDPVAPKYQNLSLLLIPTDTPGIAIENIAHQALGYAETTDVTFEDVIVPSSLIIGGTEGWNRGWPMLAGPALDVEKLEVAALAFGLAAGCLEMAWKYAQERQQFGKSISSHQAIAQTLAQLQTKLLASRQILYYAAWLADMRRPCSAETSMAKLFVTETAREIGIECQQILGAYGFADEYDMGRMVQDLLLMPVIGGSSNIQRNNIAKRLRL